ncbi:diguanylate cyclase domain-containing protein [Herminiimonas aquatilis]|uniref:Diguanylate cyclase domain-containing protein n=1 Tax=Herminiimonas aquatilis TaxID=345342 RepID=A0ABW2J9K3_9BURK
MRFWKNSKSSHFTFYLYLMLGIVAALGISFIGFIYEQRHYEQALENRSVSIGLVEELRQSSNDLTRLVRTYATTGNPVFKSQFQAVIDIREGRIPRPSNYSLAYWDLKAIDPGYQSDKKPVGEAVALLELMRRAGITREEMANLAQSKAYSDELVRIEKMVMALVDQDSPVNPAKREQALRMMVDENFLSIKAQVMRPIILTEGMIIRRTQQVVDATHKRLKIALTALFILSALLVVLILKVRQQLNLIIGCSIPELHRTIIRLGSGDFISPIALNNKNADSVLGWIAQTQRTLAQLDLLHYKAMVDSSDDAILSKTTQGIIASWNRGAEKIFGFSADEMIGKPMMDIIPADRAHEEPELLARIARGEKVDHFETRRLHRDGHLVDVSVTISPVRDQSGRVIGASKIARDITKAKAAEAEIRRLAFYDTLTGLANRRLLQEQLQHTLLRAQRDQAEFAVLFIDLDNFKALNDVCGHEAGDELLKEVAVRLSKCVRESDIVARLGGDEFVIILNISRDSNQAGTGWVDTVTQKINISLARPYHLAHTVHSCSSSIGIAIYSGQATSTSELLRQADQAMYEAKTCGRNRFHIYQPPL